MGLRWRFVIAEIVVGRAVDCWGHTLTLFDVFVRYHWGWEWIRANVQLWD